MLASSKAVDAVVRRLAARGLRLSRLQQLHPAIDLGVRVARRFLYLRSWFGAGPRLRGSGGRTFVIVNHCYDLDVDALCAATTPHQLWVLDPFSVFTDVAHYFPPGQRDLDSVYGAGDMAESIRRYKRAFIDRFARRLVRETKLDALITPSDTFYYLRPLIEELRSLGVPTIVQDKEGTIAPVAYDVIDVLRERYPPIADAYLFWSESHREFWRRVGVPEVKTRILGQPRSDFFFHRDRWPTKQALGLAPDRKLAVVFTYDADSYARGLEANRERPWQILRGETHAAARELARERPDVDVVIKAHPQQGDLAEVAAELAADPLPNLSLMTGASSASHLIVNADVVVGFQSTVMIEAMLTTKPVIYAGWGDQHDRYSAGFIPLPGSGGLAVPRDRGELDRMLRAALDGMLDPSDRQLAARRAFTDRYFYAADGHVSERVLSAAASVVADQA